MGNRVRIGLVVFLLSCSLAFFFLYYKAKSKPEPKKTHWSFKIKKDKLAPPFICKANKVYLVASQHGFRRSVLINGVKYKSNIKPKKQLFTISFKKDSEVIFNCRVHGLFSQTGRLEIREIEKPSYPRLVWLKTGVYTEPLFKVSKGMSIDISWPPEHFYLAQFKQGVKKHESLLKSDIKRSNSYFRFWDSYDIRLKAAEAPFLLFIDRGPYFKTLKVKYGQEGWEKVVTLPKAYYLKPNDLIKTKFWLDAGDEVAIGDKTNHNKIECSMDGETWKRLFPPRRGLYASYCYYNVRKTGYLKIRAKRHCAITEIILTHNKKWKFNLKTGETKRIRAFPGDILGSRSQSRYYVDGKILERREKNVHRVGDKGFIEFKGSVDPKPLEVLVFSRRGY